VENGYKMVVVVAANATYVTQAQKVCKNDLA